MDTTLEISPRNLGLILLALFCPRCFWMLMRMRFHGPFDHGGGALFTYMEQIERAQVDHHLETTGRLPKEFSPFCDIRARAEFPKHWSKFRYQHKSGVILYGVPDDIFTLADGSSLVVIDYKTAINKGEDDPFLPIYNSQVVGYCDIAENGLDLGKVKKAGLIYWEVQRTGVIEDPSDHYERGKVWVPFVPKPLEFDIDYAFLDPMLKEAKKLWKSDSAPAGREGCKDCKKVDALFALGTMAEASELIKDQRAIELHGNIPEVVNSVNKRIYDRRRARTSALLELQDGNNGFNFAEGGMVANWKYFGDEV
jgi:hypothetical protein